MNDDVGNVKSAYMLFFQKSFHFNQHAQIAVIKWSNSAATIPAV